MNDLLYIRFHCFVCALLAFFPGVASSQSVSPEVARSWIQEMKINDRGPFKQIRWFCKMERCYHQIVLVVERLEEFNMAS